MVEDPGREAKRTFRDNILRGLRILAIAVAVLIVIVGLWAFVRPTDPTEKKDFLQAVGVFLAGLVGLGGLYFTWRNLDQTRRATQRTLELTERGQITERFTRAIDQLGATDEDGNKLIEIRLGGIYALERIARDSEQDHWPIMEVLTAYVRQNSPWPPDKGHESARAAAVAKVHNPNGEYVSTEAPALTADIHAILTVLRRRTSRREPEALNLRRTNLQQANLTRADLTRADLSGANLFGADLSRAALYNANLREANLREATFWQVPLSQADLSGADLSGTDLKQAYLTDADLSGADLSGTDLSGNSLLKANLSGANLSGANLEHAYLREANFKQANLREANLWRADLTLAVLWEADLSGAHLLQTQLEQAIGDHRTKIPDNRKYPADWKENIEEQG
jgi:uncharacterized protein YjbI with pentapeptide repeats